MTGAVTPIEREHEKKETPRNTRIHAYNVVMTAEPFDRYHIAHVSISCYEYVLVK